MLRRFLYLAALCVIGVRTTAQSVPVRNASFEDGDTAPSAWTLSAPPGAWQRTDAGDGDRAVCVTGDGNGSNYWRSAPVDLRPSQLYELLFQVRGEGTSGGTPVTGPVFCNRDIRHAPPTWTTMSSVFFSRSDLTAADAWLRFGQWQVNGTVYFDDIRLWRVQPVHRSTAGVELGRGETLHGNRYAFEAPFRSQCRNFSRPLERACCDFNTDRWVFGADSEVVYRHRLRGRKWLHAEIDAAVTWYRSGDLAVAVSTDGEHWRDLCRRGELGSATAEVPADVLPAEEILVRLAARARQAVGSADADPGSFQVGGYRFSGTVDGMPTEVRGDTQFVRLIASHPDLVLHLEDLGADRAGTRCTLRASVDNHSRQAIRVQPRLRVTRPGVAAQEFAAPPQSLPPGRSEVTCNYTLPQAGEWTLILTLTDDPATQCAATVYVPDFYDCGYGELLDSAADLDLWWASSGWKIPRDRPLPTAHGTGLRVAAARNEAEAVQLVLRPRRRLADVQLRATDLQGPGGARIPAASVDILRVAYVPVSRPTDHTGVAAPWPDPLPPLDSPLTLKPEQNQPVWIRVRVPADGSPGGRYTGRIRIEQAGKELAAVPLTVRVHDFALPRRMTCQTAFGFNPGLAWRYHGVTDLEDRRALLERYWQDFSAHHISPYDPAPLSRFSVTWPDGPLWHGGQFDHEVKHGGASSLVLRDTSPTTNIGASYGPPIVIPPGGVRLRFWYRTGAAGHEAIVSFNHHDAAGRWMSGRNNDMHLAGDGTWQSFDRTITTFPNGARTINLCLWATLYAENGEPTGTVWYDDLTLIDAATGAPLVEDGTFEPLPKATLTPQIDWTAWDAAMARGLEHYGFNSFRMPVIGLGGGTFHARNEPSLLGFGESEPEYQRALAAYLCGVERHLRERGWLDEAYVYWFDEPDPKDYDFVMNGFRKLKHYAPGLRRMLTEQVEDDLVGGPNLWCPVTPHYDHEKAEQRRAAGEEFWWYICTSPKAPYCTLFIDHPATELRVWLWQTWKRGVSGILVWETNYWTSAAAYPDPAQPQNPYEDPMGWVSGYSTPKGTRRAWGNGDGRFIYPPEGAGAGHPEAPILAGPVDSIRWEMLRDGIEDYEYLVILRRLLHERADRLSDRERGQLGELLRVPADITAGITEFTKDPAPVETRRTALAEAIELLLGR